jgi:hypothetical protein
MGIGSFVRKRKAVSASRAALNGIAGHQAAMKFLGTASKSAKDDNNEFVAEDGRQQPKRDPMGSVQRAGDNKYFSEPFNFNKTRPGNQPEPKGNVSVVEPDVINRHKPTEDF